MSEEKEYKIKVPLFKDGELDQFNKMLDNDLDNIVSKVTKQVLRDKELIFMQKVIEKQQKEIEELKTITREYEAYKCGEGDRIVIASKEYFINGFFEDFLNGYISKDKIREKIDYLDMQQKEWLEDRKLKASDKEIIFARDILKELLGEEK